MGPSEPDMGSAAVGATPAAGTLGGIVAVASPSAIAVSHTAADEGAVEAEGEAVAVADVVASAGIAAVWHTGYQDQRSQEGLPGAAIVCSGVG